MTRRWMLEAIALGSDARPVGGEDRRGCRAGGRGRARTGTPGTSRCGRSDLPVLAESREAVDEQQDARLAPRPGSVAVLGDARGPGVGVRRARRSSSARSIRNRRTMRSSSSPVMTAPTCGSSSSSAQAARAEVEAVDVARAASVGERRRGRERAQRDGLAGAAGAEDGHVAVDVGLEGDRPPAPAVGEVAHAERRVGRRCAGGDRARSIAAGSSSSHGRRGAGIAGAPRGLGRSTSTSRVWSVGP